MPHIRCPHCQAPAFARTAGKTTETYREVYYYCRERLLCGHVFVVGMSIIRTIHASLRPNAEVHLAVAPPDPPANDDAQLANDNDPPPAPPSAAELRD